ncbi:diguanylate cyclase [Nitrosomonas sp.]|uniref:diguanylate cyclase domain-containing protein n=1 Tax=Nitrosomonas sp. TaxID=42353 RepID=UPI0025D9CAC8|nr:diguanylate cyclase [Nitrosomonas sp.]
MKAAKRLSNCVLETDAVARLGGDEFTIILNGINNQSCVEAIIQTILLELATPRTRDILSCKTHCYCRRNQSDYRYR